MLLSKGGELDNEDNSTMPIRQRLEESSDDE
jgi:hypothetical protein